MKTKIAVLVVAFVVGSLSVAAPFAQAGQSMMKAAVLHEHGGPENFKCEDVARPVPKDDEVLVKVMATSVNPVDTYMRQGMRSKSTTDNGPIILGYDIAG